MRRRERGEGESRITNVGDFREVETPVGFLYLLKSIKIVNIDGSSREIDESLPFQPIFDKAQTTLPPNLSKKVTRTGFNEDLKCSQYSVLFCS